MFDLIENDFVAAGRTPKGRRALREIFRATRHTMAGLGLDHASLDLIADRAGLTQAALRHYFPTREELIHAFFATAMRWFRGRIAEILAHRDMPARELLEICISTHVEYMESVDTIFWLDASAYWLRHKAGHRERDAWYRWLTGQYAALISQMQPALSRGECGRRAYVILTIVLGAWITHGRGSAIEENSNAVVQRQVLVDAAMEIATA